MTDLLLLLTILAFIGVCVLIAIAATAKSISDGIWEQVKITTTAARYLAKMECDCDVCQGREFETCRKCDSEAPHCQECNGCVNCAHCTHYQQIEDEVPEGDEWKYN